MSEDALHSFIRSIEEEDGITDFSHDTSSSSDMAISSRKSSRKIASQLLKAATRKQVTLPPEESYLVDLEDKSSKRKRGNTMKLNDRLASQGFSLLDQVRSEKPLDLYKRNLKYMRFAEKRQLDPVKAGKLMKGHMEKKSSKVGIRKERQNITCLRDPKKNKKKNEGIFSEKDFKNILSTLHTDGRTISKQKKKQSEDGTFI